MQVSKPHSADGWQARIIKNPIRRPWNGSTRLFERGDLETAWLVIAEYCPEHDGSGIEKFPVPSSVLFDRMEECGVDRRQALLYLIAASHWDGEL